VTFKLAELPSIASRAETRNSTLPIWTNGEKNFRIQRRMVLQSKGGNRMRRQWLTKLAVAITVSLSVPFRASAEPTFDLATYGPAIAIPAPASDTTVAGATASDRVYRPQFTILEREYQNRLTRRAALRWEASYLVLSAIDAAQTIDCLDRNVCSEANPIFGKHPRAETLIAVKAGLGLVHFFAFKRALDKSPKSALRLAQVSCVVQGTVVGLNARMIF
jgi:hypothetical protein